MEVVMTRESESPDIQIRLGEKKYLKKDLKKIAKRNGLTLQQLYIYIIEWFLEEMEEKTFTIKLK
jgi:hypothetical protein